MIRFSRNKRWKPNILKFVAGDPYQLTLEHRLFNIMLLLAILISILGAYQNFILKLDPITIYPSIIGGFIGSMIYFLSRIRNFYRDYFIYVLVGLTIVIISIVFFYNSGSAGPIIILHVCLFMIFILMSNGITQLVILGILLLHVSSLYYLEYIRPDWISLYSSSKERFWDVLVTFSLASVFMTFAAILFKRNYNQERKRVQQQNEELSCLNEQIRTQNEELVKAIAEVNDKNEFIHSLMKELNHRVKNNLQLVTSLLNTQESQVDDKQARHCLNIARNRIVSIGLIHQKLYHEGLELDLELSEYIIELSEYLLGSDGFGEPVDLTINLARVKTQLETAVHVGLITNEIIMNSLKHAWTGNGSDKQIQIYSSFEPDDGLLNLIFRDNGIGFDGDISVSADSFGLSLIESIVDQYSGKLRISGLKGTEVGISMYINQN